MNAYRFIAGMTPGFYWPMHAATSTRVPGEVVMRQEDGKRWFVWTRGKQVISTSTVAELSRALEKHFEGEQS